MITVTQHALAAMKISTSPLAAVQFVRETNGGVDLINQLLGLNLKRDDVVLHGVEPKIADDVEMMVCQGVIENVVKNVGQPIDEAEVLARAKARVAKLVSAPQHHWMFVKPDYSIAGQTNEVAVVAGIDTKVAIKKDGSIKKGGKEVLAAELYKKRVLASKQPVTNREFVQILISELGMTKAGATTYTYNVDRKFGQKLVKARKGGK
jgi:hypothetical protein